jgi:hypothetical protein
VRDLAQELERMLFLLQGVLGGSAQPYTSTESARISKRWPFAGDSTSSPVTATLHPVVSREASEKPGMDSSATT